MGMLQYIKANLTPNKLLFINTDEGIAWLSDTHDYIDIADGRMLEAYGHATYESSSDFGRSTYTLSRQIAAIARDSGAGKMVWAASGVIDTVTNQMVKWCYAMFLLGINGQKAYWSFNTLASSEWFTWVLFNNGYKHRISNWTILPKPKHIHKRLHRRQSPTLNPTATTYAINLGGTYKLLDGTTVTTITLNPYSGEILTK